MKRLPSKGKAIIAPVQGDDLEALYLLLLTTGLRSGEALGLRWSDVSLEGSTLSVRRVLQRVDGN